MQPKHSKKLKFMVAMGSGCAAAGRVLARLVSPEEEPLHPVLTAPRWTAPPVEEEEEEASTVWRMGV